MIEVRRTEMPAFEVRHTEMPLSWKPFGPGGVLLTCPNGHTCSLSTTKDGHEIAGDGSVSPSVVCPIEGCDFHDHIRLLDWDSGE